MKLEVTDRCLPNTERSFIERVVSAALEYVERPDFDVSLLLTDDKEIGELHQQFLSDPSPTDVMSFDMDGGAEVVVSVETATRVALAAGHSIDAEVALYIVHGLLHTVGYDDKEAGDRRRMRAAESSIMKRLKLSVREVDA